MNTLVAFEALNQGRFVKRYKRFFVDVSRDDGNVETVHCANTGSMKSCLLESCEVFTSTASNPDRKLKSSLELMMLEDGFACLNTSRANGLVDSMFTHYFCNRSFGFCFEGVELFEKDFSLFSSHKREAKLTKETRFDFLLNSSGEESRCWIEVKSVSLRIGDTLAFPDAVTERGQKHLQELMRLKQLGEHAFLFFVLMRGAAVDAATLAKGFRAAHEIDPTYSALLDKAVSEGVGVRIVVPSIETKGFGLRGYFKYTGASATGSLDV